MKLILPLSITLPRKTKADKVFYLNLNIYRNAHHFVLNQAKIAYLDLLARSQGAALDFLPPGPYVFTYTVFPANKRKFDLANVLPVIEKFTDDALIRLGVIPDDSYNVIRAINYRFGGISKECPRCELDIEVHETAQRIL